MGLIDLYDQFSKIFLKEAVSKLARGNIGKRRFIKFYPGAVIITVINFNQGIVEKRGTNDSACEKK